MHPEVMHVKALCQQRHDAPPAVFIAVMHLVNGGVVKVPVLSLPGGVEGEKAYYSEAKSLIPLMCCRRLCS